MLRRSVSLPHPVDLGLTLGPIQRGPHDATMQWGGTVGWRAVRTPDGAGTARYEAVGPCAVEVTAWGDGAEWLLEHAPALLGAFDTTDDFAPTDPMIAELHRVHRGLRIGATHRVVEAMVPSILEQKVQGLEAWRAYAQLVRRFGERAPGPIRLWIPPEPARLATLPSWEYHRCNLERRRADTVRRICERAPRLERTIDDVADAQRVYQHFNGVGPWTAAEVARVALGDADAVSVGDFHLPHLVAYAFRGEQRGSDEQMLELLEPYRGHRGRVLLLLEAGGVGPGRRAPRPAVRAFTQI